MELLIAGRYRVGRRIGKGSNSEVFEATDETAGELVAVKLEPSKTTSPQVIYEAKVLKKLEGGLGIPRVHWYGVAGNYNAMVMELLGPSLDELFAQSGSLFSTRTCLLLGVQMLERLECLHRRGFLHRDVKPANFLMGRGSLSQQVFLIDLGFTKRYRDAKTLKHMPYRGGRSSKGTARFCSRRAHLGKELSRRDDLEAMGHTLIFFNRGGLPWDGVSGADKFTKYAKIGALKRSCSVRKLCKQLPAEFAAFMTYSRNLRFDEAPDYGYLRGLLLQALMRDGSKLTDAFDWSWSSVKRPLEDEQSEKGHATTRALGAFSGLIVAKRMRQHSMPSLSLM
jgi:serine/threonine protein kinase